MTDYTHKQDQQVARIIRKQHWLELTPEEVAQKRRSGLEVVRARLLRDGITLPDGDVEGIRFIALAVFQVLRERGHI